MKKILLTLAAMAMVIASCGQNKKTEQTQNNQEEKQMKTLVAFFSATGTTKALAEKVAAVTGGDLYEIKPEVPYTSADLDWTVKTSRSSVEMADKASRPAIVKDLENAGDYGTIYIGFPVWWYTAPTIINTFLEAYDFSGKNVVFFATSGGSTIDKANAQFKAQYPSLKWTAGKVLNHASESDIKAWVESLKF
ncbi:MAG: flavodoxin [Bacteroidales bacterium]|jgi:flavodoxin|nr:flavodoxin [Bacteroidales bacterium]